MRKNLSYALLLILLLAGHAAAVTPLASSLTSTSHQTSTWSNDNTITVSWTNPGAHQDYGSIVGYSIAWNTSSSYVPSATINLDANATSTTSNPLSDGQNIYFHIRVIYDEYSPYQADTLGPFWVDTTPPSAVSSFSITRGDTQLALSWTNPGDTDLAGVVIRRDTSSYPANATSGSAVATLTISESFTAGGSGTYTDSNLANGTTYYYAVFSYDQRGAEATRNYSSEAQANNSPTGNSSAPPGVSSTSPSTNATDVAVTGTVSAVFDKDMNSSTITTTTVTLKDAQNNAVTGSVSYSNRTATFTPSSSLSYSTQYTLTVLSGSSGVKDSQGTGLDGDEDGSAEDAPTDNYSFSFTTAAATPPKVNSTSPTSSATEVEPNSAITVVFSKDMNASTITSSTITVSQSGSTVSTSVSYNALDKTATITPASWLTGGTTATVTVVGGASGVKDASGLYLDSNGDGTVDGSDGNYSFSFTVKNTPIISLSSSTLAFGSTVSGNTKDLSVTVTNTGASALHIGTASIANTTYFTATADTCSGQTVAVSGTCSITVRFAPATTGALSTTLTIPSDSGRTDLQTSTSRTVTLSGTGVAASTASLSLSASSIEFGSVTVGQNSSTQTITVTSNGTGLALSIGTVSLQTGTNFAITERTCTDASTVTVNSTCTITLRFSPASSGSKSDVLRITSNSGLTTSTPTSTTSTVNLYGTASAQSATISLSTGWNLISIPYTPSNTAIGTVLSGISGYYTIVWGYPSQAWKFYDPTDDEGSTLTTMEPGKGYWIKMTSARTLTASGTTPSTSVSLSSGWNLVGYNRTTSGAASSVLSGISGSTTIVWGYPSQAWKFYDPTDEEGNTLITFSSGGAYWIKTIGAATWTLP